MDCLTPQSALYSRYATGGRRIASRSVVCVSLQVVALSRPMRTTSTRGQDRVVEQ